MKVFGYGQLETLCEPELYSRRLTVWGKRYRRVKWGVQAIAFVPVISSHVFRGLPAFIQNELGPAALRRVNRAAGFDIALIEDGNFFVPQQSMVGLTNAMAKLAGSDHLGLLLAPHMDVTAYGMFGRYIAGAETLREAIARSIAALRYHSSFDDLSCTETTSTFSFSYKSASANAQGYDTIASAAAGELLSLTRVYLPETARPLRVELDIARPRQASLYEDVFQCPVVFNAPAVAVVFERQRLMARAPTVQRSILTLEDVARDQPGGAPRQLANVAVAQIRTQLATGQVSIDAVARSMDLSVRTLQRELRQEGADFRGLTSSIRTQRAAELLRGTLETITNISEELGYSSVEAFSRAFRKATGLSPREFRSENASLTRRAERAENSCTRVNCKR